MSNDLVEIHLLHPTHHVIAYLLSKPMNVKTVEVHWMLNSLIGLPIIFEYADGKVICKVLVDGKFNLLRVPPLHNPKQYELLLHLSRYMVRRR